MVQKKGAYTVITGASSGIGDETAKAFAARGRNLVVAARRQDNLEALKKDILSNNPALDVVVRATDLSVMENVYQFYESLKEYPLDTWINNAGFGNYDSVAHQDLRKIESMLHLRFYLPCLCGIIRTQRGRSLLIYPLVADTQSYLLPLLIVRQNFMSVHSRKAWQGN